MKRMARPVPSRRGSSEVPNLANVTGPLPYDWGLATVATEFSVHFIALPIGDDGTVCFAAVPGYGTSWPAGVVLTATSTLPGTFKPATLSPVGVGRATFCFTPNGPGSGAFTITASGPGITSVSTTTPTPTPTPTPVPTPTPAPTVTVTNIALAPASSITANSPIETVVGTLSTQASGGSLVNPVLSLVSTAGGNFKLVGSQVRFAVGNVPQGSFAIRARVTSDNAAAFEKDLAITVAAAAAPGTQGNGSVTLTGMPSTIVAGQLLSSVGITQAQGVSGFVVLYRSGADEGVRLQVGLMPPTLVWLAPQTANAYTIRVYDAATGGSLLFETAQINVTAAPGPLPAQVTQTASTGATQTSVTMNWTATGTSYRFLARPGVGTSYGSLADTTLSTNSYTFTGQPAGNSPRAIVIPQNANGFGPPSSQLLTFLEF